MCSYIGFNNDVVEREDGLEEESVENLVTKKRREINGPKSNNGYHKNVDTGYIAENKLIAQSIINISKTRSSSVREGVAATPLEVFGLKVGSLRRKRKLTIAGLAQQLQVSSDMVTAIELGLVPLGEIVEILPGLSLALNYNDKRLAKELFTAILG